MREPPRQTHAPASAAIVNGVSPREALALKSAPKSCRAFGGFVFARLSLNLMRSGRRGGSGKSASGNKRHGAKILTAFSKNPKRSPKKIPKKITDQEAFNKKI